MRLVILIFSSLLLTAFNALFMHSLAFGVVTLLSWLLVTSGPIGTWAAAQASGIGQRSLGATIICASIAVLGSLLYYIVPVNALGLLGILFLISVAAVVLAVKHESAPLKRPLSIATKELGLFAVGAIGVIAWWLAIIPITITESIRSPWLAVSPTAVIALAVAACSATLLVLKKQRALATIIITAIVGSVIAMTAVVYPLGYGFDPFLHRATVSHIIENGTITPKPLYYIGQYALELVATSVFSLPLFGVDVALVPVLLAFAALALIASSKRALAFWICLFLLPFAAFIPTTPQALAYVFALLALFTSHETSISRRVSWIFASATVITHPLAGIPVLLFVFIEALLRSKHTALHRTAIVFAILGGFALPVVFLIQANIGHLDIAWANNPFDLSRLALNGFFSNNFDTWMDALYLIGANTLVITALFAAFSIRPLRERTPAERASLLVIFALILNFLVLNQLFDFNFLISYERADFAMRLLTLMALFALPFAGSTLERALARIEHKPLALIILPGLLAALVIASQTYIAYPRHDGYARSAGFNVSTADIDAVHAIAKDADGAPYVVLANQAVSAAAVDAFGFAHYFPGDIFYYPIPTGGPLYDIFLAMVDETPSRENAMKAMQLTGSDVVYLVVNDYWWQSDRIIASAKEQADDWFALNDGAITIFTFTNSP